MKFKIGRIPLEILKWKHAWARTEVILQLRSSDHRITQPVELFPVHHTVPLMLKEWTKKDCHTYRHCSMSQYDVMSSTNNHLFHGSILLLL